MIESLTFNPPELALGRVPLSLHELGLEVAEQGADWGESQVEIQLSKQQIGSVVTDRHLKPVEMSIPLVLMDETDVPLADALYRLQQVVGQAQADEYEPTWLKREFSDRVGTAGAVGYMIHSAALLGVQGRPLAYAGVAPNIVLNLMRSPLCYSTELVESEVFSVENARSLEWELPEVLGTGPGLFEGLRVTNNGDEPWRGIIVPAESRDHPQDETKDTTAALTYEAEDLTLSGGAEVKAREGASGGNVVRANLTPGWVTILSSEIDGVGHMTHVGVRRLLARIFDAGEEPGGVELQAQFRPLGAMRWGPDSPQTVATPLVDQFALVDLGEMRPERAVLGDQRWEWRIQGRAPSGSGMIDIDQVHPYPVEQCAVGRAPDASYAAGGGAGQQSGLPGAVAQSSGGATKEWSGLENVKVKDESAASVTLKGTGGENRVSHYIKCTELGLGIPEDAEITGFALSVRAKLSGGLSQPYFLVSLIRSGSLEPLPTWAKVRPVPATYGYVINGEAGYMFGAPWSASEVNEPDFGFMVRAENGIEAGTGSADATFDVEHAFLSVYYVESTEIFPDENRLCFPGRSIEFRSDGIYRQHPSLDVWGEVVNEGFSLQASPSYMEGRAMRGLVIPSTGDLDVLPDSGSHNLEAQVLYRPGFHFSREAV